MQLIVLHGGSASACMNTATGMQLLHNIFPVGTALLAYTVE